MCLIWIFSLPKRKLMTNCIQLWFDRNTLHAFKMHRYLCNWAADYIGPSIFVREIFMVLKFIPLEIRLQRQISLNNSMGMQLLLSKLRWFIQTASKQSVNWQLSGIIIINKHLINNYICTYWREDFGKKNNMRKKENYAENNHTY